MDLVLAGYAVVVVGGVLYVGLAGLLLRHAAGRPANVALALLFVVDAASELLFLVGRVTGDAVWARVGMYYGWAQSPLVLAFAATYLGPTLRLPMWATRLWPYALLAGGISVWLAIESGRSRGFMFSAADGTLFLWVNALLTVSFAVVPLLLVRSALREPAPRAASDILLATGVALWWGSTSAEALASAVLVGGEPLTSVVSAGIRGVLTLWLLALLFRTPRARPELGRVAHAGAVAVLAALAIGVASAPSGALRAAALLASSLTWMVIAPAIVAYAILRHQLLGVDVKLRFAISKSTLAAVFIAAFFLASEGAQLLFGQENELVGLVAAGGLVFALAPLQRAAERLAERAVPVATGDAATAPSSATDGRAAYRVLLRRVLADGRVSPDEEIALAHVATQAGLTPADVVRLRHDVEAELAREGAA